MNKHLVTLDIADINRLFYDKIDCRVIGKFGSNYVSHKKILCEVIVATEDEEYLLFSMLNKSYQQNEEGINSYYK